MRYEVWDTDQLRVKCSEDHETCVEHCHWRLIDTVETETIAYFYDKRTAQMMAEHLNEIEEDNQVGLNIRRPLVPEEQ